MRSDTIILEIFRFSKNSELCSLPKEREKKFCKKWALICHSYMLWWLIGINLGEIICESSNWQLFRVERIAKCSYFILSTQNIKFYWFVMKIKTFLLPIWWYSRGLFPHKNKYFGVFVLNGLKEISHNFPCTCTCILYTCNNLENLLFFFSQTWKACPNIKTSEQTLFCIYSEC